jgi:hypothetical protein
VVSARGLVKVAPIDHPFCKPDEKLPSVYSLLGSTRSSSVARPGSASTGSRSSSRKMSSVECLSSTSRVRMPPDLSELNHRSTEAPPLRDWCHSAAIESHREYCSALAGSGSRTPRNQ